MSDIFFYLIENYAGISQCPDAETLARRLAYEGFEEGEVRAAIAWLELLREPLEIAFFYDTHEKSLRVYHEIERLHLGSDNLQYITSLNFSASISNEQRERIIERCMMLPVVPQNIDHFKALVLTALWADNQDIDQVLLHSLLEEKDEVSH